MKQTLRLFQIGLKQITKDGMLLILLPAPFLVGMIFKYAIPFANSILEERLSFSLKPWYGLVDGMLICLTSMFVALAFAFLILEERDEGITAFYQITPTGGYSYLMARIGIPMIGAWIVTVSTACFFNISGLPKMTILASSTISILTGIILAMVIVALAGNRVEGLALAKLTGISFLGLILVWFIPAPYAYFLAFLPSFWIGKLILGGAAALPFLLGLLLSLLWIIFFTRRFLTRIG